MFSAVGRCRLPLITTATPLLPLPALLTASLLLPSVARVVVLVTVATGLWRPFGAATTATTTTTTMSVVLLLPLGLSTCAIVSVKAKIFIALDPAKIFKTTHHI